MLSTHVPRSAEGFPNLFLTAPDPETRCCLPVSVAHAPRVGEGDRHRRSQGRTRGSHTPRPAKRPWLSPFLREHRTSVAGIPPHLNPFSTRRRHGNRWTPPMSYSPPQRSPNCSGWTRRRSPDGRTPDVSDSSAPPAAIADSVDRRSPRCSQRRPPRLLINRHAVQFPDESVRRPILSRKAPTQ